MRVNREKLAELHGVEPRTVTNWVNSTPACPSHVEGRNRWFDTGEVFRWLIAREVGKALENVVAPPPDDIVEAERRKAVAEAMLAEMKVAEKEGSVVPLDIHEAAAAALGERVMAVIQNIPSTYTLDLERVGVAPADAQAVLERIGDALVRQFRAAADELDELEDEADERNTED